ncbi:hypothetical protein IQ06DRAFT_363937 [Phaeosphaeriaceae sp. SRC1lsM3a]|nr:hypothetical protein IQ06DRAFT_363937 [Stagonospora sp. SRC1lsM3a]
MSSSPQIDNNHYLPPNNGMGNSPLTPNVFPNYQQQLVQHQRVMSQAQQQAGTPNHKMVNSTDNAAKDAMRQMKLPYDKIPSSQKGEDDSSPVEDFIDRVHKADISTQGFGSGGENWEVIDGAKVKKDAEDVEEQEWYLVGKSEAEKKVEKTCG